MIEQPWTEPEIVRLRALWASDLSTQRIADALHRTKCSVVSKAHRVGCSPRPSPIKRNTPLNPRYIKSVGTEPTLPVLPSLVSLSRVLPPDALVFGRVRECSWPMGDVGARSFRFCDAEAEPGKPYCAAHCAAAYLRVTNPTTTPPPTEGERRG